MFILRFIGRILSIGFILFIVFVVSNRSAKADGAWTLYPGHFQTGALQIESTVACPRPEISFR